MTLYSIIYILNVFFFIYMFVYAIVFFSTTFFAALNLDDFFVRKEHMSYISLKKDENYIPISIIVPAFNEEITIVDSIHSLLNLDYPEYEILIVNDGSRDNTAQAVIEHFDLKKIARPIRKAVNCKKEISVYEGKGKVKVTLVNKENGGKADALNMGINASRYPLFVCMDADSMLQQDALRMIVEPFLEDDETIAVGGNVKVSNHVVLNKGNIVKIKTPVKLIVFFQIVEYLRVFLTSRVSFNGINSNLIVSGAFGIYNKHAAINVGGYTPGVIGEDMEIIVKMHAFYRKNKIPYRISYVTDAICWTQVPENYKILRRQRRRWHIGMGQSLKSHWFMCMNPKYGAVGLIGFPYFLFFEYFAPLIEILGIMLITVSFVLNIINVDFFIFYLLVYMLFNMLVSSIVVLLEKYIYANKMSKKLTFLLLIFCILESFGYRQICSAFRLTALFSFRRHEWGTMTRVKNLTDKISVSD